MSAHGDILPLTTMLAIFFLGLVALLWCIAAQADRPVYRDGSDPNDVPPLPEYRNGADPGSVPPTPDYRNGGDPGAGSGCIAYRDGSDPDTVRYIGRC